MYRTKAQWYRYRYSNILLRSGTGTGTVPVYGQTLNSKHRYGTMP
jgi:hypothetical protein